MLLQQHLPFTVLKPILADGRVAYDKVATALTVHGIETSEGTVPIRNDQVQLQQHLPFTVLKL